MSARVKIGSAETKKELLFFLAALSFGFKWSLERSLLKRLEKPNRTKQTIGVRPLDCPSNSYIGGIPLVELHGWGSWWGGSFDIINILKI